MKSRCDSRVTVCASDPYCEGAGSCCSLCIIGTSATRTPSEVSHKRGLLSRLLVSLEQAPRKEGTYCKCAQYGFHHK